MDNPTLLNLDTSDRNRSTRVRIRVKIPKKYHYDPIISHLASHHNLEVNILAAMLGANAQGDGWFDLELRGHSSQIDSALIYLSELNVEILYPTKTEPDGW